MRAGDGDWARGLFAAIVASAATAAEPAAVNVQTAPGRFEIAAIDASAAHAVAATAEEGWRALATPLGLPDAFPTPIYARLAVTGEIRGAPPFRVTVEPGGVVSIWIATPVEGTVLRRALVQGLLMRLAVARHGVMERLAAPLWLEHAAVGWWQTRAAPAMLDAYKQESATLPAPGLAALLRWQRGGEEPRAFVVGALWLLTFLQAESGRAREWPALLPQLLGGAEPTTALARCYPDRFSDDQDRELWWQTGYYHASRARSLPVLDAAESRAQLAALARFVYAGTDENTDRVVPSTELLARAAEPAVAADLLRRAAEAERLITALHPFYRNAGLSLAELLRAARKKPAQREEIVRAFERDWRDAVELEQASRSALDKLERREL